MKLLGGRTRATYDENPGGFMYLGGAGMLVTLHLLLQHSYLINMSSDSK